jgi:hypothetical protein
MKGLAKHIAGIGIILLPEVSAAQCAMCRAVLESGGSRAAAEGINNGIVYLMAIPYILVAVVFFMIYRKMKA